jgi:hypothetical protein
MAHEDWMAAYRGWASEDKKIKDEERRVNFWGCVSKGKSHIAARPYDGNRLLGHGLSHR